MFEKRWKYIKLIAKQYTCDRDIPRNVSLYFPIEHCIQDDGISVFLLKGELVFVLIFICSLTKDRSLFNIDKLLNNAQFKYLY